MSFWSDRYPLEGCRPSINPNINMADLIYNLCLKRTRQLRLDGPKCRGYSIPGSSDLGFFKGSFSNWSDNVIQESIGFCRQWGSINVFVVFQTSIPLGSAFDSNIGRPLADWPGVGMGYSGPAIPAQDAVELGIVDEVDFQTFIGAQAGIRDQLSPELVAAEREKIIIHRKTVAGMKKSDESRVSILDTFSEIGTEFASKLGYVSGKIVGMIGSVFGQGLAGALGGLGPVGVIVVVGGISAYAYKKLK